MKRLLIGLAAAATVATPIAFTATTAQADPRWDRHDYHRDYRGDRRDHRDDRWDRRSHRWDRYGDSRWSDRRHNGYYYRNKWYYGPPPGTYQSSPHYRPGYTAWRRGAYLPPHYRGYVINDYRRHHLRPPPRGYAWHQVGDDYLLIALATGLIYEIINN